MKFLVGLSAAALLANSTPACSNRPANHAPPDSPTSTDGHKTLPGGARFSRESRAMQACLARASQLGRPTVSGLGLSNQEGFVVRGYIEPGPAPAAGSSPTRRSFECAVGLDGVVTAFILR